MCLNYSAFPSWNALCCEDSFLNVFSIFHWVVLPLFTPDFIWLWFVSAGLCSAWHWENSSSPFALISCLKHGDCLICPWMCQSQLKYNTLLTKLYCHPHKTIFFNCFVSEKMRWLLVQLPKMRKQGVIMMLLQILPLIYIHLPVLSIFIYKIYFKSYIYLHFCCQCSGTETPWSLAFDPCSNFQDSLISPIDPPWYKRVIF